DAVHVEEIRAGRALGVLRRLHLAPPLGERAVMPSQEPRGCLPDLRDPERIDEAVERDPAALVDRADQLLRAEFAPAFARDDHLGLQPEDVARRADEAIFPELGDVLRPQPLDVEAVARDEMLQPLDRLRRANEPAGAA